MRHIALLVLTAVSLVAGCGGDDGDDGGGGGATKPQTTETQARQGGEPVGDRGGREAAQAFIACLDEPGYKPQTLNTPYPPAVLAEDQGYEVEPVFVESEEGAFYSFYVSFFANEAQREKATQDRDLNFGSADVPKPDERGSAVVTWTTKDAREKGKAAVDRCLG